MECNQNDAQRDGLQKAADQRYVPHQDDTVQHILVSGAMIGSTGNSIVQINEDFVSLNEQCSESPDRVHVEGDEECEDEREGPIK